MGISARDFKLFAVFSVKSRFADTIIFVITEFHDRIPVRPHDTFALNIQIPDLKRYLLVPFVLVFDLRIPVRPHYGVAFCVCVINGDDAVLRVAPHIQKNFFIFPDCDTQTKANHQNKQRRDQSSHRFQFSFNL